MDFDDPDSERDYAEVVERVTRELYERASAFADNAEITVPVTGVAAECDLAAAYICGWLGHALEGRIAAMADGKVRLVGRCARCGVGALSDGS